MSKNQTTRVVYAKDILPAPIILSRDIVKNFSDAIEKRYQNDEIIAFNFAGIEFISRSAAAELIKLKESYKNKKIIFCDLNDFSATILRSVAANKVYPKKETFEFNPKKVTLAELLD